MLLKRVAKPSGLSRSKIQCHSFHKLLRESYNFEVSNERAGACPEASPSYIKAPGKHPQRK